jgi:hypothetical protein
MEFSENINVLDKFILPIIDIVKVVVITLIVFYVLLEVNIDYYDILLI